MSGVAIGVDLGTSGLRVALVDSAREVVAFAAEPIGAEVRRDPEAWWSALGRAMAALARTADLGAVRGIAVDGTSGTILPVGAAGRPLAAASLYNDRADRLVVAKIGRVAPGTSAATGPNSPLARAVAWPEMRGATGLLHEADWLAGRLSGRWGVTDWNNALKTGFDPVAGRWPAWIGALDFDPGLLPKVVAPGAPIGTIDAAAARALGLPGDVVVHAGTTDGCAGFLATGAAAEGEGVTALGSTLTIKLLAGRAVNAPRFGVYSHRMGDLWLAGGASNSGGAALLRHFTLAEIEALTGRIDPAVASALDYYPLPGRGERFPIADPGLEAREAPRPADDAAFLHGLLEGIARIEALGYALLADLGAPRVRSVFSVGGGAGNPAWTAIRARVLGVEMRAARSSEAAVGTAGLALSS